MQLCKVQLPTGIVRVGVLEDGQVRCLEAESLSAVLHAANRHELVQRFDSKTPAVAASEVKFLAPLDRQEVWAAGVTYKRSEEARKRESVGAAQFYDLVYTADRPEIFFKATPHRVVGPGGPVRIRRDSKWSVPEPELGVVLTPGLDIVGYTIGNDMSARDIEGENPLYLPQAKVYDHCCAIGPVITLAEALPAPDKVVIQLEIERGGKKVFAGETELARLKRTFRDLADWLGRDNVFPDGVILLTGTGIVPPDDFTLQRDDVVRIDVTGIGQLVNVVEQS